MEAITARNRGLTAVVCLVRSDLVVSPTRSRVNLALTSQKAFSSGIGLRTSSLSTEFDDQGYAHVRCLRKDDLNKAFRKEMANSRSFRVGMYDLNEREMMRNTKGRIKMGSSSFESDDGLINERARAKKNWSLLTGGLIFAKPRSDNRNEIDINELEPPLDVTLNNIEAFKRLLSRPDKRD